MKAYDIVKAYGHPNIRATHRTTLEITREEHLTPRGDCIIGVRADKAAKDLSLSLKNILKNPDSILVVVIEVDEYRDIVLAQGDPRLLFTSNDKIIIRKSNYVEPATIGVKSNKAARDIDRGIIEILRNKPDTVLTMYLIGLTLDEIKPMDIDVRSII